MFAGIFKLIHELSDLVFKLLDKSLPCVTWIINIEQFNCNILDINFELILIFDLETSHIISYFTRRMFNYQQILYEFIELDTVREFFIILQWRYDMLVSVDPSVCNIFDGYEDLI